MRSSVTAVLVASQGGEWLDATIAGIASQTRAPNTIIAVNNGGNQRAHEQLMSASYSSSRQVLERVGAGSADTAGSAGSAADRGAPVSRVIGVQSRVPFGRAISAGLTATAPGPHPDREWIWLLSEDACPEPEALAHMLARVERAQSVVVAGPKLVDWDHPERIIELGQSLTTSGTRWLLRRQELDQQQHDHLEDVLGVGPVGMLIRRDVWEELGGFDPAYPTYDDGLDFSVRTRLAGYRVEVVPEARVRFARSGIAGPRIDRARKVLRTAHRHARTALPAFFLWLGLPFLAIGRVFWALIREQPGNMFGEFFAALAVFFRPRALLGSRARVKRASKVGWTAIRPLRVDQKTVRTARMIDREFILAAQGRTPREMHFLSTGGLAVLIATAVAAVGLSWWAISHTSLIGGGLAPLSDIGELWRNTRALDGVPADPFAWVLAVLGSLTFWNPSHALVIFMVLSVPLAALGAWIWAAQISESATARTVASVGFALSPVLLGSLASGRIAPLILAAVTPWLLLAATRSRESWSWAGTASLLAAIALACAPVLIPVAVVFLVIGVFSRVRGALRVLTIAIVPAVLFGPKIIATVFAGRPFDLLMDPGVALPFTPGNTWHLLLGFPEFGLEGWGPLLATIGLGGPPATLLVGVLLLPIALLALLGLYTGRVAVTVLHALLGGLGLATAVASTRISLTSIGDENVFIWTGSGLVLYWLSVLGLAAVGADTARRAAPAIVSVALIAALVAVAPLGWRLVTGDVPMRSGDTQVPAVVHAAGEQNPNTRTLVVSATGERSLRASIVTGTGVRLDTLRTALAADEMSDEDRRIAELVGTLASTGGDDVGAALAAERVNFVLLQPGADSGEETLVQRALDQHAELASVGSTSQGLLWRVNDAAANTEETGDDQVALVGTSFAGHTVWIAQLVLIFSMLLLALPTGEVVERPERRKKPGRARKPRKPEPAKSPRAADAGQPADDTSTTVRDEGDAVSTERETVSDRHETDGVVSDGEVSDSTKPAPVVTPTTQRPAESADEDSTAEEGKP